VPRRERSGHLAARLEMLHESTDSLKSVRTKNMTETLPVMRSNRGPREGSMRRSKHSKCNHGRWGPWIARARAS
jgi:hypothetical protein